MSINRTSWKKSRSGNPRGRPRAGEELGALLRQLVDRKRFAEKLCELCYAGDIQAMRLLENATIHHAVAIFCVQSCGTRTETGYSAVESISYSPGRRYAPGIVAQRRTGS